MADPAPTIAKTIPGHVFEDKNPPKPVSMADSNDGLQISQDTAQPNSPGAAQVIQANEIHAASSSSLQLQGLSQNEEQGSSSEQDQPSKLSGHLPADHVHLLANNQQFHRSTDESTSGQTGQSIQVADDLRVGQRTRITQDLERGDYDVHTSSEQNPEVKDDRLLSILDVPFQGTEPMGASIVIDSTRDLRMSLEQQTRHPERVARIFECTIDPEVFFGYHAGRVWDGLSHHISVIYGIVDHELRPVIGGAFGGRYEDPPTDITSICSQLSQSSASPQLETIWTRSFLMPREKSSRRHPLEPRGTSFCCFEVEGDRLVIVVVHHTIPLLPSKASTIGSSNLIISLPSFIETVQNPKCWTCLATGSRKQCAALLVLDFLLTCVCMSDVARLQPYIYDYEDGGACQLAPMLLSMLHLNSKVPNGTDARIIDQLQECEQILQDVQDVTAGVLFLLELLNLPPSVDAQSSLCSRFENLHAERYLKLRGLCSQRRLNCQRRIEQINRTLEARNKLLSIHESISVKRLTILAAFFLPASLASSFLSMTTRFQDLGPLLYDWFGSFVLISSVTIVLYFAVRVTFTLKSKLPRHAWSPKAAWARSKTKRPMHKWSLRIFAGLEILLYLAFWAFLLSCFVLGMFRDRRLGGIVLGYGFAGMLGVALPMLIILLVYMYCI